MTPKKPLEAEQTSAFELLPPPKPFVRWAGGKRRIAHALIETFPNEFEPLRHKFFEPFVGGGALTFALGNIDGEIFVPGNSLLISDMNPDLINTYEVIRDSVEELIVKLKKLQRRIDDVNYYKIRAKIPVNNIDRAARFIYLNKTCYNGLWRVNRDGLFNVPFDKDKTENSSLFSQDNLYACSQRLKGASIQHQSFENAVESAKKGDLVYFDPPYIPLTPTSSFSAYSKEGFGEDDHHQLASVIHGLTQRGVFVLFSNSDTPLTRKIFKDHLILRREEMRRSISSDGTNRKNVFEILGMNYSHLHGSHMGNLKLITSPTDKKRIL